MSHNLAHLLYELRRKAGHSDFLSEEAITVIRQALLNTDINITVQTQVRGEGVTAGQFTAANSEHLNVSDDGALEVGGALTPEWTLSGWARRDSGGADLCIISKHDSGQEQFRLMHETIPVRLRFFTTRDIGESSIQVSNVQWTDTTDFHFFILQVFTENGIKKTLVEQDNISETATASNQLISAGTGKFEIGSQGGGAPFWNGKINRIGFWDRRLTTAEKTTLYSDGQGLDSRQLQGSLLTGLKGYWDIYEASGQRNDAIGANNLTDINTVTQFQEGPKYFVEDSDLRRNHCTNPSFEHDLTNWVATNTADGKAAQFVRTSGEYLSITDNVLLSTGDINFSIVAWVYLDTKTSNMVIAGKFTGTGNLREWRLRYSTADDRFQFRVSPDGTNAGMGTVDADNFGAISTGAWHFIVVEHDKDANTITIQVNNGTVDSTAYSSGLIDLASAFNIGADGSGTGPWDGRINSVGFWKRRLSSIEKTFLYNSGNGKPYQALGLLDDGSNIKENLIAYWNLDEVSGTRVDSHNSNNLTDNNTVTQAIGLDLYVANARDKAQSNYGQNSLKLEMVNSSASGEIISQAFTITGLSASEVWSISVSVRIAFLTSAKFTLRLEFLDSSDVVQATHNIDSTTISTTWSIVDNLNRTSPSTTTKLRATLILQSTSSLAFGSLHCDGLIIEESATAVYFDGDSEKSFWEGDIHNSTNIKDALGKAAIVGFFTPSA